MSTGGLDHDAERVAVGIDVDPQRLVGVVTAIEAQLATETDHPLVLSLERLGVRHGQIEVQLLGYRLVGPRRPGLLVDLLERHSRVAGLVEQHEPIPPVRIGVTVGGRFVAGAVVIAEEFAPELGRGASIERIEHDGPQTGMGLGHAAQLGTAV